MINAGDYDFPFTIEEYVSLTQRVTTLEAALEKARDTLKVYAFHPFHKDLLDSTSRPAQTTLKQIDIILKGDK